MNPGLNLYETSVHILTLQTLLFKHILASTTVTVNFNLGFSLSFFKTLFHLCVVMQIAWHKFHALYGDTFLPVSLDPAL